MSNLSRRRFHQSALSTVAAGAALQLGTRTARAEAATPGSGSSNTARRSVRLGGPIIEQSDDPGRLAEAHRRLGYRAAFCPAIKLDDAARIADTEKAFAQRDVVIAEVGRWVNLLDADQAKRKQNLQTVTDGLALADAVGALCCVDIAGSYSTEQWYGPHPDNVSPKFFDATVENARHIIDAVKPRRAKFCLEMMGWALPDSPDAYLKLIAAVDRKAFGVHMDVCNLINSPMRFYRNSDLIHECFDKLGPHVVSWHAKELAWKVDMNVHFREVPAGQGKLDFTSYLRRLAELDHDAPLMLEHCANEQEYTGAREFLQKLAPAVGVKLD